MKHDLVNKLTDLLKAAGYEYAKASNWHRTDTCNFHLKPATSRAFEEVFKRERLNYEKAYVVGDVLFVHDVIDHVEVASRLGRAEFAAFLRRGKENAGGEGRGASPRTSPPHGSAGGAS